MKLPSVCLLLCLALSASVVKAESTDTILSHMDKAAPSFTGVTADLKMTTFTKILGDSTVELGTLKMQRRKPNDTRAVVDFSGQSDARILSFESTTVKIFYPKLNQYTEVSMGKNGNVLNQFLLLGFGSSGKDLAASYTIINEGVEKTEPAGATKLMLTPKSPEVRERIEKVAIWIADGATYPTQQQFFQPSGNYQLVVYSKLMLNPTGLKVELKLPPGAKKQKR
jgi:outer membrane lipoprotein-sorting protein